MSRRTPSALYASTSIGAENTIASSCHENSGVPTICFISEVSAKVKVMTSLRAYSAVVVPAVTMSLSFPKFTSGFSESRKACVEPLSKVITRFFPSAHAVSVRKQNSSNENIFFIIEWKFILSHVNLRKRKNRKKSKQAPEEDIWEPDIFWRQQRKKSLMERRVFSALCCFHFAFMEV